MIQEPGPGTFHRSSESLLIKTFEIKAPLESSENSLYNKNSFNKSPSSKLDFPVLRRKKLTQLEFGASLIALALCHPKLDKTR